MRRIVELGVAFSIAVMCWTGLENSAAAGQGVSGGKGVLAKSRCCQVRKGCSLLRGGRSGRLRKCVTTQSCAKGAVSGPLKAQAKGPVQAPVQGPVQNGSKSPVQGDVKSPVQGPGGTVPDDDDVVPTAPIA